MNFLLQIYPFVRLAVKNLKNNIHKGKFIEPEFFLVFEKRIVVYLPENQIV